MKKLSTESPLRSGRYLKSEDLFFNSSKLLAAQITDLLDFVWPTATAMWNLRWQVNGYIETRGQNVTVEELHQKFGSDTEIIKPNYYRACVELTWEDQQEQFAGFLLTNVFAFYESWVTQTLSILGVRDTKMEKHLQFPSNGPHQGILFAINTINSIESTVLKDTFFSIFSSNKKYCIAELDNLIICYRYFKEIRNSIIHKGGIVNDALESYSRKYEMLTPFDLKAKEKPAYYPMRIGARVRLNIRGVIGFLDIILKIVTTLDAEMLCSQGAENEFLKRWEIHRNHPTLKKSDYARKVKIAGMIRECSFPRPSKTEAIEKWLAGKSLIILPLS